MRQLIYLLCVLILFMTSCGLPEGVNEGISNQNQNGFQPITNQFPDVPTRHWALDEINFLFNQGIIRGFEDETFRPGNTVSRADAALMIASALNLSTEEVPAPGFRDVDEGFYAYQAIAAVANEGIIQGYQGNYSPRSPLTRGQMAAILQRAFDLEGTWNREFQDVSKDYLFHEEIQALAANRITIGYPNGTFQPGNHTKRDEFSVFLSRAMDDTFKPEEKKELHIHHLNVGQGDSTLILTPNGKTILVDAGTATAGENVVAYLKQAGISTIDRLIITHAHADHVGGAVAVMSHFEVGEVLDSGIEHTSQTFEDYLIYIDEHGIEFDVPNPGDTIDIDPELDITVVNSGAPGDGLNDSSISLYMTYNNFSYLITGDAEERTERRITNNFTIESDVLRVGHHGSRTSTNPFFLAATQPSDAIISYGVNNRYGHPHSEVVERLRANGISVYTTIEGPVLLVSDGTNYSISGGTNVEPGPNTDPVDQGPIDETPIYPININTADHETLQLITGVGEVIAGDIISYRETHGGFNSIDDIKEVRGIGDGRFASMRDQITVN